MSLKLYLIYIKSNVTFNNFFKIFILLSQEFIFTSILIFSYNKKLKKFKKNKNKKNKTKEPIKLSLINIGENLCYII